MSYQEKINEDVLCVLRFAVNNNKLLEVGYVNLEREDLEKKFTLFSEKYQSLSYSTEEVCNKATEEFLIIEEAILIKAYHSHCRNIANAYTQLEELGIQGYVQDEHNIENTYKSALENPRGKSIETIEKNREYDKTNLRNRLLAGLKEHLIAYRLSETYQKMKQEINNENIVAYSHRYRGRCEFSFKASEIFKFRFLTNFGYGSASYFFLIMTYKDIEILPYSDWIIYRFAGYKEVFRYSQKYILDNSYWEDAMKYTQEAYNLSVTNPIQFISIYIIKECERMVSVLEEFLEKHTFTLRDETRYNNESKQYLEIKLGDDRNSLVARAEKIAGALRFTNSIASFKDIEVMPSFIVRIEKCNEALLPKLKRELEILSHELPALEQQLSALQSEYEQTQSLLKEYKLRAEVVDYELELKKSDNIIYDYYNYIEPKLKEKFPELKRIYEVKENLNKKITNSNEELTKLKIFQKEYSNYSSQIVAYFDNRQKLSNAS